MSDVQGNSGYTFPLSPTPGCAVSERLIRSVWTEPLRTTIPLANQRSSHEQALSEAADGYQ